MYDVIAIGCGPFNLGLAALADGVDDVRLAVLDSRPEFTWHRGLMFDDAMLQVTRPIRLDHDVVAALAGDRCGISRAS